MLLVTIFWVRKAPWLRKDQVSGRWLGAAKQNSVVLLPQCVKSCGEISIFGRFLSWCTRLASIDFQLFDAPLEFVHIGSLRRWFRAPAAVLLLRASSRLR